MGSAAAILQAQMLLLLLLLLVLLVRDQGGAIRPKKQLLRWIQNCSLRSCIPYWSRLLFLTCGATCVISQYLVRDVVMIMLNLLVVMLLLLLLLVVLLCFLVLP